MKIGEIAQRTGVSIRMLRYYEEQGLLIPARTSSGYRNYDKTDIQIVKRITALGACGMTLPVIKKFLPCAIEGREEFEPCDELKFIIQKHFADVDRQMAALTESRTLLSVLLNEIDTRLA